MANKKELALLEKAFAAEIEYAIHRRERFCIPVIQTKSKLAGKLVEDGLLEKMEIKLPGPLGIMTVEGYALTEVGRFVYCVSCDDVEVGE